MTEEERALRESDALAVKRAHDLSREQRQRTQDEGETRLRALMRRRP